MAEQVRLVGHADVVAAAHDAETFSSRTSRHLHVPNGMDGAEHRAFRALVDRQMTPQIVAALEPVFEQVAGEVVAELPRGVPIEAVSALGEVFAVRAQCRWLGWPRALEGELLAWMAENYAAARHPDAGRNAAVAAKFDEIVGRQVAAHRNARTSGGASGGEPEDDATHRLLDELVDGRPLTEDELVSILRNWTAGDLGSLARCVGVVVHRLAQRPRWQQRMRRLAGSIRASRDENDNDYQNAPAHRLEFDAILGECLRHDDPFVANKRITTCPVITPSGESIEAGTPVLLDWVAANRDPEVFSDSFDPHAHAAQNIVFGIGPHICPGRDLSYAELRAVIIALLESTRMISPAPGNPSVRHDLPLGGWAEVHVVLA